MKATYIPTRSTEEVTEEELKEISLLIDGLCEIEFNNPDAPLGDISRRRPEPLVEILRKSKLGLTPEKLAACLARYSRSNEGIDTILSKFSDKSPDAIFKFVDYGHASIGGLTGGIAIALDQVSMLMAYKLFEFAQMADGQESSTRYITIGIGSMPHHTTVGIPEHLSDLWNDTCELGFELYKHTIAEIEKFVAEHPESTNIPEAARKNPKMLERMLKNYALDRARYFLPMACYTNIALVATARVWADICRLTESLQWPEAINITKAIREQLEIAAPNLVRHSYADNASIAYVQEQLQAGQHGASAESVRAYSGTCECRVEIFNPPTKFNHTDLNLANSLRTRATRYSHAGTALKRQIVQAEWSHISFAELRDLNRHRTGYRFSDLAPKGFYLPEETKLILQSTDHKGLLGQFQTKYAELVALLARQAQPGLHTYGYFLGTQVAFEHTQAGDKFLYELELRTGLGAHFRYAEHLRQAGELYFEQCPETQEFIQIGTAEPE